MRATEDEVYWVKHAASLRGLSMAEYIRRAINVQLRKEGVDAVLLRESDRPANPEGEGVAR